MQQTFPNLHALKYALAKLQTSLNLKILHAIFTVTQGAQATRASRKLPPPDGGHLGCDIWQRLPRFLPSPVTLYPHLHYSADPPHPEKAFEPLRRREVSIILGDQGAVSGGGKKSKRVRKNSGKEREEEPLATRSELFWLLTGATKPLFFLPNHKAARLEAVSRLLTRQIHTGQLLAICLFEEKSSNHRRKCRGDCSAYPRNTLDFSQVSKHQRI